MIFHIFIGEKNENHIYCLLPLHNDELCFFSFLFLLNNNNKMAYKKIQKVSKREQEHAEAYPVFTPKLAYVFLIKSGTCLHILL